MKKATKNRPFIVSFGGWIWVDTTVAVISTSAEEARKKALAGVHNDATEWLHNNSFREDPFITDVSEEADWDELTYADQKQLLQPKLLDG